jgi:hypothetical protein
MKIRTDLKTDEPFLKDNFGIEVMDLFGCCTKEVENFKIKVDIYISLKVAGYNLQ